MLSEVGVGLVTNINSPNNSNDLPLSANMNAPEIQFGSIDDVPIYIRFEPENNNDNWNVESVRLTAQRYDVSTPGEISQYFDDFSENNNGIWLGYSSGLIMVLVRATF